MQLGTQQPLGAPDQRWPWRASCQGALSLTCLPAPGLCTQCPLPSILLSVSWEEAEPLWELGLHQRGEKPPGDGPPRGPQVFLGPMAQQPYTSRDLTGLALLPGEDLLDTKVLGPEPQPSSSPNQEAR